MGSRAQVTPFPYPAPRSNPNDGAKFTMSRSLGSMSDKESVRDTGTCLGGFLGMFLGAMLGFAICIKFIVDKVARNDGTVDANQALLPFLGVLAAGCIGAVAGAVFIRLVFAAYAIVFSSPGEKRRGER